MRNEHEIVGLGEVGISLQKLFADYCVRCALYDIKGGYTLTETEYLHICFGPFNEKWISSALDYIEKTKPSVVIVHSTVSPGTCQKLQSESGVHVVMSPVVGIHPELSKSMRTFFKIVGTDDTEIFNRVADQYERVGMRALRYPSSLHAEIAKLLSTTTYAVQIAWEQDAERICNRYGLEWADVVPFFRENYNDGYCKLGHEKFKRAELHPGFIAGHCCQKNIETFLADGIESDFMNCVLDSNERYAEEHGTEDRKR